MQDQVYTDSTGNPSENVKRHQTANVPGDPVFDELLAERIVGYHPLLSRALKLSEDVPKRLKDRQLERATIYLSNLLYWTPKSARQGWLYKSVEEIEAETDLSRRAQDGARELLRAAGVIEERRRRQVYYRIRWASLKPLLRLAIQARHVERGEGRGDQVRHVEHSGKDRHVERASSVSTKQDEHLVHGQSSSTRVPALAPGANGSGAPNPSPGMDDEENQVKKKSHESKSTTPPSPPEISSRSGREEGKREPKSGEHQPQSEPRRSSRAFVTLPESMLEDAQTRPADELSEEAATIGRQLCEDLGRPYAPGGLAVRLSEECIRRGCPEAVGAVAAKASRDDVRSPDGYLRTYIKGEIQERKDYLELGGDPVARFTAARDKTISQIAPPIRRGPRDAPPDPEGRQSLVPRAQTPVYGVRRPELERDPEDYFKRGGRGAKDSQE